MQNDEHQQDEDETERRTLRFRAKLVVFVDGEEMDLQDWLKSLPPGGKLTFRRNNVN
jgi:hypothetical protein